MLLTDLYKIEKLFNKITDNSEFEIIFNNYKSTNKLSRIKFIDLLHYIKSRSNTDKLLLLYETSLDISYSYSVNNLYRISIY